MIRLFDKDSKIIKYISDGALLTVHQNQRLTDEGYISEQLTIQMNILDDDIFSGAEYMTIPAKGHDTLHHLFWIKDKYSDNRFTHFTGVLEGIEELSKTPVIDVRPQNATLRSAVEQVLDGTNYIARYVADTGRRSSNAYFTDIWSALKRYASVWRVEMQLFVEVTETGIGARYIDFRQQVGVNNGARVVYGHNALEILKEEERSEIYTALIGRGNGEEVGESTEGDATFGRKINFKDVEWKKSDGDPLDKPLGQYYLELPEATERYGIKYGNSMKPKIGFVDVDTDDQEEVLELTHEALMQVSRPKVMFRASAVYLKGDIGDTVRVVRKDRNIDYNTRIFDITHDRLEDSILDIKLGDNMLETQSARERRIAGNAAVKVEEQINNNLTEHVQYIVSANGLNRNYYSSVDPRDEGFDPMLNDIWYRPDPDSEGDTILYIWNGSVWEEVTRTFNNTKVADLIKDVQELKDAVAEDVEITIDNIIDILDGASEVNLSHIFARLIGDDRFSTLFYQEAENIGFVYREGEEIKSIIAIQNGTPFIRGEHIILDGNTIVDGDFTVTEQMLADSAVFDKLKASGIDASEINVINLDFDSMAGGDIELARGIRITNNGAVVMEVTSDGKFRFDATAAGLDMGTRNLILKSDIYEHYSEWSTWGSGTTLTRTSNENLEGYIWVYRNDVTSGSQIGAITPLLSKELIAGTPYTIRFKVTHFRDTNPNMTYMYFMYENHSNESLGNNRILNIRRFATNVYSDEWIYEITAIPSHSGPARIMFGTTGTSSADGQISFYIKEPMIVEGNKAPNDWSPAPEDLIADKADRSELDDKADKSDLNNKADKSELNKKADKSELDGLVHEDNLTFDNRNLLIGTSPTERRVNMGGWNHMEGDISFIGVDLMREGGTFTFSAEFTNTDGLEDGVGFRLYLYYDDTGTQIVSTTSPHRVYISQGETGWLEWTLNIPSRNYVSGRWGFRTQAVGDARKLFTVKNEKLEIGERRTTWQQSPEDTEESMNAGLNTLTRFIDDIQVDLSTYQSVLESKQDASEYVTKMEEIDDALEKEQEAMEVARTDISTLLGRTSAFEQTLGEHTITKQFVDTYMTEGEEGLFIHNKSGTQGIRISQDRIDFVSEGDEEIFYISGQNFYIKSGIIVNSFRIGAHEEVRLNNNSTVTRWVGG